MKILTTTRYVAVQGLPMIYHIDDGAYELVNNSIRDLSNSRYIDMAGYLYDISGRETRIILPEMMNRFLTDERFVSMTNSVYEYDHIQYSVGTDDFVYNVSMKVIFFPKSKLVTDLSLNPIHKNVDKMIMFDHDDCYYIRRNGESITTSGMKFKLSSKAINIIGACGFLFVQKHDRSWTQYMINKTNETEGKFFESTKSLKIKKLKNITNVQSKLPCMYITTRKISNSEWLYKLYHKHDKITLEFEFKLNEEIKNFCSVNYSTTFKLFDKITLSGENKSQLFTMLTNNPKTGESSIYWNFEKFLIDRNGNLVDRFRSTTTPENKNLIKMIETLLEY